MAVPQLCGDQKVSSVRNERNALFFSAKHCRLRPVRQQPQFFLLCAYRVTLNYSLSF